MGIQLTVVVTVLEGLGCKLAILGPPARMNSQWWGMIFSLEKYSGSNINDMGEKYYE